MTARRIIPLARSRYIVLTAGAAVIAGITAVLVVGAPPVPAAVGIAIAVTWLWWRAPRT
jgi:hypothetical protein